ncbi:MAG: helix-turn-helix domain-containing protein [Candidatus Limnocylindrales bacterium]
MVQRVIDELEMNRRGRGISCRELGRRTGISHTQIGRVSRGDLRDLGIGAASRMAAVLGLDISVTVHPVGDPVRDAAHLALIRRFSARLPASLRWRTEVPIPLPGDRRSADGVVDGPRVRAIEAETRLDDIQAMERRIRAKQRDLGIGRIILLVADTRHNRAVIAGVPELGQRFPVGTRRCLAALGRGVDPGSDCLVII